MLPPFEGAIFAMPENSHYFYGNGRGEDEGGEYDSDGMEDFLGSDMSDY